MDTYVSHDTESDTAPCSEIKHDDIKPALEAEAPRFVRCGRLAQGVNAGYLDH